MESEVNEVMACWCSGLVSCEETCEPLQHYRVDEKEVIASPRAVEV